MRVRDRVRVRVRVKARGRGRGRGRVSRLRRDVEAAVLGAVDGLGERRLAW